MLISCLSLFSLVAGCSDKKNSLSYRIVSKKERPLASAIFAHLETVNVLIIDGKRFDHVQGVEKFYIELAKMNAVLFVVDKEHKVTYHIYKMDTREDIQIEAVSISIFGWSIGMPNCRDTIEEVGDGKIVLTTTEQDKDSGVTDKYLTTLDMEKRAVVADISITFDKAGKVIREYDAILHKWTIGTDPNKRS